MSIGCPLYLTSMLDEAALQRMAAARYAEGVALWPGHPAEDPPGNIN